MCIRRRIFVVVDKRERERGTLCCFAKIRGFAPRRNRFTRQNITVIFDARASSPFPPPLLPTSLPLASAQDARRMPVYNPAGKYLVRLTVNGVARKVGAIFSVSAWLGNPARDYLFAE